MNEQYIRPTWDQYFLEILQVVGKRSTCDRGRTGCVIVRDRQILTTGYAGSPPGLAHCDEVGHQMKTVTHEDGHQTQHCMRTTHAEQNAIAQAAKLGIALAGATLYCKMTPCATCAKSVISVGIKNVICAKRYHAGEESEKMFGEAGVSISFIDESVQTYARQ